MVVTGDGGGGGGGWHAQASIQRQRAVGGQLVEAAPAAGAHVAIARGGEAVAGLRRHLDVVVAGIGGETVVAIGIGGGGGQLAQLGPECDGHAGPRAVAAVELTVVGRVV